MSARRVVLFVALVTLAALRAPGADVSRAPTQKGRTTLRFTERHPLSGCQEICRRTNVLRAPQRDANQNDRWEYKLENESFEVFVPGAYKPGVPHGL